MNIKNKFYFTASIKLERETESLKKEAASVIKLPAETEKQPDLGYFSAIMVSTGTNLNGACFLGSELVAASDTVVSKALDVEHEEEEVIGHIYSSAFTNEEHESLDLVELASSETATLDSQNMHIQIGCIIYKNRFPDLYQDIKDEKYCVSMECYYKDFDLKVGETVIPKVAASAVGIDVMDDSIYGKSARIVKDGKEIAQGKLARVLRGICFSGVGIVKNPANPASVILEAASVKDDEILINLASEKKEKSDINNVTSKKIETETNKEDKANDETMNPSDQEVDISHFKSTASKHVEALFNRKRSFEENKCKLDRLRDALEKASKTI